jgi:methylated-DNA-[protein]-cysteine S-methyltransferase
MKEIMHLVVGRLSIPLGEMLIATDTDRNMRAVKWTNHEGRMLYLLRRQYGNNGFRIEPGTIPGEISAAMHGYFAGNLGALDSLPVKMAGAEFQRAVWQALTRIPYGQTVSYAELAKQIDRPRAIRAVGHANRSNPNKPGYTLPSRHRL